MIELRLFAQPLLTVSVVTGFITFVCVSRVFFLGPFYLETSSGLTSRSPVCCSPCRPSPSGWSPRGGWLSDRFGCSR